MILEDIPSNFNMPDFLEKICVQAGMQAVISEFETNCNNYKERNPSGEKVERNEKILTWLREYHVWAYKMYELAVSSQKYNYTVTNLNLSLKQENEELRKEVKKLSKVLNEFSK